MSLMSKSLWGPAGRWLMVFAVLASLIFTPGLAFADEAGKMHGEADLVLPDLDSGDFMGMRGKTWLYGGLVI
ncbi:MAG: hypothetical protein ACKO9Q_08035, partial [Pirellula sp.]